MGAPLSMQARTDFAVSLPANKKQDERLRVLPVRTSAARTPSMLTICGWASSWDLCSLAFGSTERSALPRVVSHITSQIRPTANAEADDEELRRDGGTREKEEAGTK